LSRGVKAREGKTSGHKQGLDVIISCKIQIFSETVTNSVHLPK